MAEKSQDESLAGGADSVLAALPGTLFVAITYIYFLIFAQFGFLRRLAELGLTQPMLRPVMAAMALGGVGISLLTPRLRRWSCPRLRLQFGFWGCGFAAVLSMLPLTPVLAATVAACIGLALGLLTVTLVTHLPRWTGPGHPLWKVGWGTGLGYLVCNLPPLFQASASGIAAVAALLCFAGAVLARLSKLYPEASAMPQVGRASSGLPSFPWLVVWFTALVWLDSAAFLIIQNSPVLKAGTWSGDLHLMRTGGLHLAAALLAVWLLQRHGLRITLSLALGILGLACLALAHPGMIGLAALLYPVGVSFYSVALVATPALLLAGPAVGRRAGALYAVAGWMGSALGIGMAQNLHHVPGWFVLASCLLFVFPLRISASGYAQLALILVGMAVAWTLQRQPTLQPVPLVEQGRQVYIAEGCIHCHSQYVRPDSPDVALWGPASSLAETRQQRPPLIGNRRQGPDLAQVGARRTPLWLQLHLEDPRALSPSSPMPSYPGLFSSSRGTALVAYLSSLHAPGAAAQRAAWIRTWQPSAAALVESHRLDGSQLYGEFCTQCHSRSAGRRFGPQFAALAAGPVSLPIPGAEPAANPSLQLAALARISKYGIPGTEMPGHETLTDAESLAIAAAILRQR